MNNKEKVHDGYDIATYINYSFIAVALVAILLIKLVYTPSTISGRSMDHTLNDGDVLVFSKLAMQVRGLNRGDIVAIGTEIEGKKVNIVKRIIALPGDNIKILDNNVYLNDIHIKEDYISEGNYTFGHVDMDMGDKQYYVMGDNRVNSSDSRDSAIGVIEKKEILGLVINNKIYRTKRGKEMDLARQEVMDNDINNEGQVDLEEFNTPKDEDPIELEEPNTPKVIEELNTPKVIEPEVL